jgi:hypothetical protein
MIIKKDSLNLLPIGIQRYVEEYFAFGLVFCSEAHYAFLSHDFPLTKNLVRGRAPISSDAVDNIFSEGIREVGLTKSVLAQQENTHEGVNTFKF